MVRLPALEVGELGFHLLLAGATKQLWRKRKLRSPQLVVLGLPGEGKLFEQWHDVSCSRSAKFVCSKKICDNATTTTPSPKNTGTHITSPCAINLPCRTPHCNNYSGNKCCFRFDHTRHPRFPGVEVQEEEEKDRQERTKLQRDESAVWTLLFS